MAESHALAFREQNVASILSARALELRNTGAKRKRVLEEDDFADALESIIRRDFYPDLPVLDAQLALLDALDARDRTGAQIAYERLVSATRQGGGGSSRMVVGNATPASVWEQPADQAAKDKRPSSSSSGSTAAGVDKFLSQNTSEDNASFGVVLAKDQAEKRRKLWWMQDQPGQGGDGAAPIKMIASSSHVVEGAAASALMPPPPAPTLMPPPPAPPRPLETLLETLADDKKTKTGAGSKGSDGTVVAVPSAGSDETQLATTTTAVTTTAAIASSTTSSTALAVSDHGPIAPRTYHKQGSIHRDERPNQLDYGKFTHKNSLMFPPEGHGKYEYAPGPLPAASG